MEPRISIITLGVSDLQRSLQFYRDGLGLPTTWTGDKGIVFFQTQGGLSRTLSRYRIGKGCWRGIRRCGASGLYWYCARSQRP